MGSTQVTAHSADGSSLEATPPSAKSGAVADGAKAFNARAPCNTPIILTLCLRYPAHA